MYTFSIFTLELNNLFDLKISTISPHIQTTSKAQIKIIVTIINEEWLCGK